MVTNRQSIVSFDFSISDSLDEFADFELHLESQDRFQYPYTVDMMYGTAMPKHNTTR